MVDEAVIKVVEYPALYSADNATEQFVEQLISASSDLGKSGLLGSASGDLSVRLPGDAGILATPLVPFVEQLTPADLLEVSMNGHLIHKRGRPSFSLQMHLAIYKQRPDVIAIAHSHAAVATVMGICELPIPPVTFDSIPFVDLPRVPAAIAHDTQWGQTVATHLAGGAPAALLVNEGVVTLGADLRTAVRRMLALEETARILVVCYLLQQVPATLPPSAVDILREVVL